MLLAKLHMNRAVFTSEAGATSFTFDPADMTAAIGYVDDMVSSLHDTTTDGTSYWFNFDKDNDQSPELIWALKQEQGADACRWDEFPLENGTALQSTTRWMEWTCDGWRIL